MGEGSMDSCTCPARAAWLTVAGLPAAGPDRRASYRDQMEPEQLRQAFNGTRVPGGAGAGAEGQQVGAASGEWHKP